MKITPDGQVTIPRHIRDALGLVPNSDVEWEIRHGEAVLRKARDHDRSSGHALVEQMRGRGTVQMATDEIMALTRGD